MPVRHPGVVLVLPHRQRAAGLPPLARRSRKQGDRLVRLEGADRSHKGRKVFQQIEKKARHQLAKFSKPFPAANAHFVPWEHVPELIDKLEGLKAEFEQAVEDFLLQYPQLRADWQFEHPDVPDAAYPAPLDLRRSSASAGTRSRSPAPPVRWPSTTSRPSWPVAAAHEQLADEAEPAEPSASSSPAIT
jgi:hypothetical protein